MATAQQAIERLHIEATMRGVHEAVDKMNQLSVATDEVGKSTQRTEARLASIQRKYDQSFRVQQEMARVERDLQRAQDQGLITMQRRAELLALAAERHGLATASVKAETAAVQQLTAATRMQAAANDNAWRRRNLTYQLFDVGQMAALGQNPAMLAMQQGPQILQLYAGAGGVNAALADTMSLLSGVAKRFGPVAIAAGVAALAISDMQGDIQAATGAAVSFGDTALAVLQVLSDGVGTLIKPAVDMIAPWFQQAWSLVEASTKASLNFMVKAVLAMAATVKATVETIPDAFIVAGEAAANGFIAAIEFMANEVMKGINGIFDGINSLIPPGHRITIGGGPIDLGEIDLGGAAATKRMEAATASYKKRLEEIAALDPFGAFKDEVSIRAVENMNKRLAETEKAAKGAAEAVDPWKGLRTVDNDAAKAAKEAQDAWEQVGIVVADIFATPFDDASQMLDQMIGQAGQLGQALQKALEKSGNTRGATIAGAGLGGFSSGYSSGRPIMGAIGGAVSGFATGASLGAGLGPIGAVIGGIGGLLGGIFGKSRREKEEERQRQEQLSRAMDDYNMRARRAAYSTGSLADQLKIFDLAAAIEVKRLRQAHASAQQIARAQATLDAERATIRVNDARARLSAAYEKEAERLSALVDRHRAFAAQIDTTLKAMRLDSALTNLSPTTRLGEASSQFDSALAAARRGDTSADLTGSATRFLQEAMSFYSGSQDYFAIFDRVQQQLKDQQAASTKIATDSDKQLAKLDKQIGHLIGIETGVKSLAAALRQFNKEQAAATNAIARALGRSASEAQKGGKTRVQ